jgi:HSP20 family protein
MLKMTIYDPFRSNATRFIPFSSLPTSRATDSVARQRSYPSANLCETTDEYLINLDLPGVAKGDLSVRYEDGSLTIKGTRRAPETDKATVHLQEIFSGDFSRTFSLPSSIQVENISASVEEGVLTVRIPKQDSLKSRQIEIAA